VDKRTNQLTVETPPQDLPALGKGTEKSEWECQQVLKKLEEEHNKRIMVGRTGCCCVCNRICIPLVEAGIFLMLHLYH
jgi:hypothetical protein